MLEHWGCSDHAGKACSPRLNDLLRDHVLPLLSAVLATSAEVNERHSHFGNLL